MTPKEKAKELINNYYLIISTCNNNNAEVDKKIILHSAKQCALVCVQEMKNIFATALLRFMPGMTEESVKKAESKYLIQLQEEIENYNFPNKIN